MKLRLIPRLKPYLDHQEILSALKLMRGNIEKFEQEFADKFECRYGVMFSYGRVGLYSLLKIWGLSQAEVICPAYTCVVVAHAIVLSGNIPVFVDCAENSFNMSYEGIEKAISPQTRVIVVTHLFGYPMDVHKIQEIVKKSEAYHGHKIYVIQDVAHSFGCRWNNELVTKFGDAALFGLNISKTITSIFGGMIITNNSETHNKLLEYINNNFKKHSVGRSSKRFIYLLAVYGAFNPYVYGLVNALERKGLLNTFVKYYHDESIEFPGDWDQQVTEMEARVGLVQLAKYDQIIECRTKNALRIIDSLSNSSAIRFLPHIDGATYSHCVGIVEDRNAWVEGYRKNGIQLGILIEYSIPYIKAYAKYAKGSFPISKYYCEHTINFPLKS